VKLPGDSRALSDARFQGHIERVLHLPHPQLVRPRQERQEQTRARGAEPESRTFSGTNALNPLLPPKKIFPSVA
jgi:hypothetical protein